MNLDDLEKLVAAATALPGLPWRVEHDGDDMDIVADWEGVSRHLVSWSSPRISAAEHDAALIVAAVNALPSLIEKVRLLEERSAHLAWATGALDSIREHSSDAETRDTAREGLIKAGCNPDDTGAALQPPTAKE